MRSSNSDEEKALWDQMVAVGQVARAHGRRGEVAVNPLTDFPDRFGELHRVFVLEQNGETRKLVLESSRMHSGRPLLKFRGVSDIGGAEDLAGRELRIPEAELRPLPEGSFYHFQILGCEVWDREKGHLGTVAEILTTGGTDVLVVRREEAVQELLVPLCRAICWRVSTVERRIDIEAPEGLVTLNAD